MLRRSLRNGDKSIQHVQDNPYALARDIHGIGFKTADTIAQKMGIPHDAPQRVDAGIEYVLTELTGDGHVCYPHKDLLVAAAETLEVSAEFIEQRVQHLSDSKSSP